MDSAENEDAWTNTANADAGSDSVGTFDFALRSKLHDMVLTFDSFDMQSIPGAQQHYGALGEGEAVKVPHRHGVKAPPVRVGHKPAKLRGVMPWNRNSGGHLAASNFPTATLVLLPQFAEQAF